VHHPSRPMGDEVAQGIDGIVAADAVVVGIDLQNILRLKRIMQENGGCFDEADAAAAGMVTWL